MNTLWKLCCDLAEALVLTIAREGDYLATAEEVLDEFSKWKSLMEDPLRTYDGARE